MGIKDKAGRLILPGAYIVYAVSLGRSAGLRWAKVLEVSPAKKTEYGGLHGNCALKVQPVDAEWSHKQAEPQKVSYLRFSDRTVIVDEEYVPEVIFRLLNNLP